MKSRKPKPPKHPGDAPKRSDKRKIIWEGDDRGRPARIIAIDMGSNDPFPCQFIYECLLKDNLHNESWGEEGNYGMSLLEKQLVFELTALNGKMPKWGTAEAQAKRDEREQRSILEKAKDLVKGIGNSKAKAVAEQEAADLAETDSKADA